MPLYDRCQRTLVVDGKVDAVPPDWEAVQVPRINGKFCWGRMWDAGVFSARNDKIIYLDSDRLLPKPFLTEVRDNLADDMFMFTSSHYMMVSRNVSVEACKRLLAIPDRTSLLTNPEFMGKFRFETRFKENVHGPSKNVMSGSTAFTRKTYIKLGGVDQWYCGHGAFADTDFHMQAATAGCSFLDLNMTELHYHHHKMSDDRVELDDKTLYRMSLDNFIYYCDKWKLPMVLAENLAGRCGVIRPSSYIGKKLKEIKEGATGS